MWYCILFVYQGQCQSSLHTFSNLKVWKLVYYHGKLGHFEKGNNAKAWLDGKAMVMCATNTFGMGTNKADVWFVIHDTIPGSLEDYYIMFKFAHRNHFLQCNTLMIMHMLFVMKHMTTVQILQPVCNCVEEMHTLTPTITIKQLALTFKGSKSKLEVERLS